MDNKQLIKQWIEYLKGLKIAKMQSNPDGTLNYTRPVTLQDIVTFLEVKTDFQREDIANAIRTVLMKSPTYDVPQDPSLDKNPDAPQLTSKKSGSDLSTWMHSGMSPARAQQKISKEPGKELSVRGNQQVATPQNKPAQQDDDNVIDAEPSSTKLGHDPYSISDIDYKEKPSKPPEKKKPWWKRMFNEDIKDTQGPGVKEKDVEEIFRILTSGSPKSDKNDSAGGNNPREKKSKKQDNPEISPEEAAAKKEEDMRKMKRLIRDVMTDSQRKALWRMLTDEATQ